MGENRKIPGLLALSHEDIPNWQPLNTEAGQAILAALLAEIEHRYGRKPDAVCFDNVMSIVAGSMKDEEAWQAVLPLIQTLAAFEIGQVSTTSSTRSAMRWPKLHSQRDEVAKAYSEIHAREDIPGYVTADLIKTEDSPQHSVIRQTRNGRSFSITFMDGECFKLRWHQVT
jgi:hypothetical protein